MFRCIDDGSAESITVSIEIINAAHDVKCAIYKHGDLSFVAETEERTIGVAALAWETFTFATRPTLERATDYILVVWAEQVVGAANVSYDAGAGNQGHTHAKIYDGWPDPLVPNHDNNKYSIYCTYTSTTVATTSSQETPPSITYGHGYLTDCDDDTSWGETVNNMTAANATLTVTYGDVFKITAVFDDTALDEYCFYEYDITNITSTAYPKYLVRWKTSESSAGAKALIELVFTDSTVQNIPLGYSTEWTITNGTITSGKTIDQVRFYADDDGTDGTFYVYYDFLLLYKGAFPMPNTVPVNLNFPPRYANIGIPVRVGDITQNLGSESAFAQVSCDLDIGTWKRYDDSTPPICLDYVHGEVFYDISHNSNTEPWQWLDTGSEQFKITLQTPVLRRRGGNESTHVLDLVFREYRLSDASNETYVERFGLNL